MTQTVVLKVGMSCEGCAGAVKRALAKMEGVESFDIDLKEQKVTVKANAPAEAVFQTVSKTGKKTSFWEAEAPAAEAKPAEAPAEPEAKPSTDTVEAKPAETEAKQPADTVEAKLPADTVEISVA